MPDVTGAAVRRRIALDLQARTLNNAKTFMAVLDRRAYLPASLEIVLVSGDATLTRKIVSIESNTGKLTALKKGLPPNPH